MQECSPESAKGVGHQLCSENFDLHRELTEMSFLQLVSFFILLDEKPRECA